MICISGSFTFCIGTLQAFAKLNCNKYNKELGMELKVKVAPTFHLYKNSVKVAGMTGAKIDALRQLVATHK